MHQLKDLEKNLNISGHSADVYVHKWMMGNKGSK